MLDKSRARVALIVALLLAMLAIGILFSYRVSCADYKDETDKGHDQKNLACELVFTPFEEPVANKKTESPDNGQYRHQIDRTVLWLLQILWNAINDPIALITGALAIYTYKLWSTTQDLVKGGNENTRTELRAYVSLGPISRENGGTFCIPLHNTGRTPAHEVSGHMNFERIPVGGSLEKDFSYPDRGGLGDGSVSVLTVGAGQTQTLTFAAPLNDMLRVLNGELGLFMYGHVDYTDVFNRQWNSYFCYQYFAERVADGRIANKLVMYKHHNHHT